MAAALGAPLWLWLAVFSPAAGLSVRDTTPLTASDRPPPHGLHWAPAPPPPWSPPHGWPKNPCPCGSLCRSLSPGASRNSSREFFAFHPGPDIYNGSLSEWRLWDWSTITTVAVWSVWAIPADNWGLLCKAHAEGVRVVVPYRGIWQAAVRNATERAVQVQAAASQAQALGLDGINFDVEGQYNHTLRGGLTSLVCEMQTALRAALPAATLTFDLDITPNNPTIQGGYDYPALSRCLSHIVPMAYDMTGRSVAPNAPLSAVVGGLQQYKALGIAPSKLVVALPWYAYDFTCAAAAPDVPCVLSPAGHHGDWYKVHRQLGYGQLLDLYDAMGQPNITYDRASQSKWFDYTNRTTLKRHRVSFDDPETLLPKYAGLLDAGVAGVGAWTVDATHRGDVGATAAAARAMWAAVRQATQSAV